MKIQNVITQLVGDYEYDDEIGDGDFQCHQCSAFNGRTVALIFSEGHALVYSLQDPNIVEQTFAIKATLEPIDP